jgi:cytochrome c oxidase subunit 2
MTGLHSILDPAGPQAGSIAGLWWLMFWVCTGVFVLVMLALLAAIARRHRTNAGEDLPGPAPEDMKRRFTRTVATATGVTVLLLFVLLVASVATGRATSSLPGKPLALEITGHQWWWEVEYLDAVPSRNVTTANEIHIPVGRPVTIKLSSSDVIHSFWVPNLNGKKDLIPGHDNSISIQADRPGVYYGQCAEFCGFQHAHMGLIVIAEPPERYQAWLDGQRQSAVTPTTPEQLRGQKLVELLPCANCHTIHGTQASGRTGPDLTHLASRRTIAAGMLPNTRGHLGGWLADPQTVKPGTLMPPNPMDSRDLQSVLDYLEILK